MCASRVKTHGTQASLRSRTCEIGADMYISAGATGSASASSISVRRRGSPLQDPRRPNLVRGLAGAELLELQELACRANQEGENARKTRPTHRSDCGRAGLDDRSRMRSL